MERVAIEDAGVRLEKLAERVEAGETVTLTRDGRPVVDLVAHGGTEQATFPSLSRSDAAIRRWLEANGIENAVTYIAPDFDDPLTEDFLLRPLP